MKTKKVVCNICGREVTRKQDLEWGSANGAVVGKFIEMRGHKACVDNVDDLVVTPNRLRVMELKKFGLLK